MNGGHKLLDKASRVDVSLSHQSGESTPSSLNLLPQHSLDLLNDMIMFNLLGEKPTEEFHCVQTSRPVRVLGASKTYTSPRRRRTSSTQPRCSYLSMRHRLDCLRPGHARHVLCGLSCTAGRSSAEPQTGLGVRLSRFPADCVRATMPAPLHLRLIARHLGRLMMGAL